MLIMSALLVPLFFTILLFTVYKEKRFFIMQQAEDGLTKKYHITLHRFANETSTISSLAALLAGMPGVQQGMSSYEPELVIREIAPVFMATQKHLALDTINFIFPDHTATTEQDRQRVLAYDMPGGFTAATVKNMEAVIAAGVVSDNDGLCIKGSAPVFQNGLLVGTIELTRSVNKTMVESFIHQFHFDFSLLIPGDEGFRILRNDNRAMTFNSLKPNLERIMDTGAPETLTALGNNRQILYVGPLTDATGIARGLIALTTDITSQVASLRTGFLFFGTLLLGALAIMLLFRQYTVNKLLNEPIQEIVRKFKLAGEGDLTQRMATLRVNCSAVMQCGKTDCIMYGKTDRCWEKAGSLAINIQCPQITSGEYQSCTECKKVYQEVFNNEMSRIGNYFNAFMAKFQDIVGRISHHNNKLANSSTTLAAISQQMSAAAEQTSHKTNLVAANAENMSANLQTVATASNEAANNVRIAADSVAQITDTFQTVANNLDRAKTITTVAVGNTTRASETVRQLGVAAQEIGMVTETIAEISEQTKLLALNATIEAARAGEAGKGFAVVAGEIKELARQTAKATGEIHEKILSIQNTSSGTVEQIIQISTIIADIDDIVSEIATIVNQQSSSAQAIAQNVISASREIEEISSNVVTNSDFSNRVTIEIADVNTANKEISDSSLRVRGNAEDLLQLAEQMKIIISNFLIKEQKETYGAKT
jgi:methyl-accepting chemotaxis protein